MMSKRMRCPAAFYGVRNRAGLRPRAVSQNVSRSSIALALPVFVGCSQRVGDFTIISTKNVDIGSQYKKVDRFKGTDSRPDVLFIPLGVPDLKQAVDDCIEEGKENSSPTLSLMIVSGPPSSMENGNTASPVMYGRKQAHLTCSTRRLDSLSFRQVRQDLPSPPRSTRRRK